MFKCWSCGNDYPDVPYPSKAEAAMWEDRAAQDEHKKIHDAVDKYRNQLIESYRPLGMTTEYQQGLLDGLRLALMTIVNTDAHMHGRN